LMRRENSSSSALPDAPNPTRGALRTDNDQMIERFLSLVSHPAALQSDCHTQATPGYFFCSASFSLGYSFALNAGQLQVAWSRLPSGAQSHSLIGWRPSQIEG